MENATKALMIAAAVIVAVLIISLAVGIFTSASEQVDGQGDLTEYQIQAVNDKFTNYIGTNMSGTEVNALLTTVFNHNMSEEDAGTRVAVKFSGTVGKPDGWKNVTTSKKPTAAYTQVSTANRYSVTAKYNTNTGLINSITIKGIE